MKRVGKTLKRFWPLYLMFLPGAIYLFINCYIPMFGIQIASAPIMPETAFTGAPGVGWRTSSSFSVRMTPGL